MAASYYVPTREEVDGFEALLADVPAGGVSAALVSSLASKYWARKLAAGQSLRVGVTDEYGKRHEAELHPPEPAAEPAQTPTEPETPEPPDLLAGLPPHERDRLERKAAALVDHPYVKQSPIRRDSRRPTPHGGYHGTVRAADGTILAGLGAEGVDEADAQSAQAALAAIPQYGEPGWERGKRQAVEALGKASGQRTPLSPERAAKLRQAEAELAIEARAGFLAEVRQREAEGKPPGDWKELGAIAARHGHRL